MVDSFGPRNHGEMCSQRGFDRELYLKRPRDAYGALPFLQPQPFVQADRVGVISWSQGGGAVLYAIAARNIARPPRLPLGDFRAAVAFCPASCDEGRQQGWTSHIPLLGGLVKIARVWRGKYRHCRSSCTVHRTADGRLQKRRADDLGPATNPAAADDQDGEGDYRCRNRTGGGLFFRVEAASGDQSGRNRHRAQGPRRRVVYGGVAGRRDRAGRRSHHRGSGGSGVL